MSCIFENDSNERTKSNLSADFLIGANLLSEHDGRVIKAIVCSFVYFRC